MGKGCDGKEPKGGLAGTPAHDRPGATQLWKARAFLKPMVRREEVRRHRLSRNKRILALPDSATRL